ncbi:hypothetical protein BDY24DRAFT_381864 [Mrakia frigida]|uniref:uncharacterized protein n=1 Tax=Mrakia frigida TaxID=29902 RepID=UPI003FCBF62B
MSNETHGDQLHFSSLHQTRSCASLCSQLPSPQHFLSLLYPSKMANTSSKRVASANETALWRLTVGMVATNVLYFALRHYLRPRPYFSGASLLYVLTLVPAVLCFRFLRFVGSPKRNALGHVYKAGEALDGKGPVEWATDTIYVIWACTVLGPLLGYYSYWLLLAIPSYVGYQAYLFAAPMLAKQQAQQAAQAQRQAPVAQAPVVVKEPLTRTQQKKEDKKAKLEKAQRGVRR